MRRRELARRGNADDGRTTIKRSDGIRPADLDDNELRKELQSLYRTREDTFLNGTDQALEEHTRRMFQLEEEYLRRFPREAEPAAQRTRLGARSHHAPPGTKKQPQRSTTNPRR